MPATTRCDILIVGGGTGGVAAALGAASLGCRVIITEETDWIGGQLTAQGVPPDEHPWIETRGCNKSYRDYRGAVRAYYKTNYPLSPTAKNNPLLNPGNGAVSQLCHEPRVSLAVLLNFFAPYLSNGKLVLLTEHRVRAADMTGDTIRSLVAVSTRDGHRTTLSAPYFIDATELGELLPLSKTEFVTGTESRKVT